MNNKIKLRRTKKAIKELLEEEARKVFRRNANILRSMAKERHDIMVEGLFGRIKD